MSKKIEKIKSVENEKKPNLVMTPEIMGKLLSGELSTEDPNVNYLIEQLIIVKQQYERILPEVKRKDEELRRLQKALNDASVQFDTLQMLICNLWPN